MVDYAAKWALTNGGPYSLSATSYHTGMREKTGKRLIVGAFPSLVFGAVPERRFQRTMPWTEPWGMTMETEWVPCSSCVRATTHGVLFETSLQDQDDDEIMNNYKLLSCRGRREIAARDVR
jgi:hypothetical protein